MTTNMRWSVPQSRQDAEMAEALARAADEIAENFQLYDALAQRFFAGYATSLVGDPLRPGETIEVRLRRALAMCFATGRIHSELGYRSPLVEVDVDTIDDLADAWMEEEEERRNGG